MPRVPLLETNVRSTPLQAVRQSTDAPVEAFGGQGANYGKVQQAAQSALGNVGDIYLGEKKKADDARSKEAYAALVEKKNILLWDPQNGAISKKGKNAVNITDDYQKEFGKAYTEIRESLGNDAQREMLDAMYVRENTELQGQLLRHSNSEFQDYQRNSTGAVVSSSRNDAVMNHAIPGKVDESIATQRDAITSYMSQNGASPEQIQVEVEKATSQTYASVIDQQLTLGDDLKASNYFKEVKPYIKDASVLTQIEKRVQDGSIRGESRRIADTAISKSKSMTEALASLKGQNIEDTKVYDAAVDRVRTEYTLKDTAERERNEDVMNGFYNQIFKTRTMEGITNTAQWDALSPAQKDSLLAMHKRMAEGLNVVTDPVIRQDLLQLASSPATRDVFLKTDLVGKYAGKLNERDMKDFQKLQYGLRKQDAEAIAKLDGIMTDDQIVKNAMLNVMKVDPGVKRNADEVAAFRQAVSQRISSEQQARGKKMTDTEKTDLANSMAIKVVTEKGLLWNSRKPFYQVQPGQPYQIEVNEIPAAEITKIQETLRKVGQPVTNENIIKLYQAKYFTPRSAGVR